MPRRKTIFRLPFLKIKINKRTITNILGFFILALGVICLLSFINLISTSPNEGRFLSVINNSLISYFGGLAIFFPLIIMLLSGHFFNTKKLKFVKFNISGGILLIFISLLGLLRSGQWGNLIFENLSYDFSFLGAVIILLVVFIVGLILFLDTSIDVFILFVIRVFKMIINFFKQYVFRNFFSREKKKLTIKKEEEKEFIADIKPEEKKPKLATIPAIKQLDNEEILIKPFSKTSSSTWVYPPLNLLFDHAQEKVDRGDVNKNAAIIEKTLDSFGIRAKVVEYNQGPTVTQYAIDIVKGTRLSKITALSNDLALALAAPTGQVRIEAPIPGKSLVGIEIPNIKAEIVTLKRLLSDPIFTKNSDPLLVPLGLDVSGNPHAASIDKMPHVLIAGQTGAGKSVLLNSWICTFLFRTRPDDLRLILVDPKRVELTLYNDIPHLLTPVVVEPKKIISALKWTVNEMEKRYKQFVGVGVRNLAGYNETPGVEKMPYIVFIIDELAALMTFAPAEAEELITRIAQMSRATGIHLVLATQRPSVEVITGLMKANIPTRIAFNVASMIDSRVIIDMPGAEKLLGRGDMLYLPPDQAKPRRIQGPFITEKEVNQLVKFLRTQQPEVHYTEEITEQDVAIGFTKGETMIDGGEKDPLFDEALAVIMRDNKASASYLQRRLSIGYSRAARILDQLEAAGYVGPASGSKPREILKRVNNENVNNQTDKDSF
ncbi:MAG: DNA translocase FtsK [Microgenomates group bacterium]|nr:DNA translocase FtsK [Microgenomates group bacterium]